jgi:hypothetical protein
MFRSGRRGSTTGNRRLEVGLLLLSCLPVASGCQQVDTAAASGGLRQEVLPEAVLPRARLDAGAPAAVVTVIEPVDSGCASPFALDPLGTVICGDPVTGDPPVVTETPPIQTHDGGVTFDACVQTTEQALQIRETFCSGCHAPPASQGGFNFILEDARLSDPVRGVSNKTRNNLGQPVRLVIPGDPDNSWIYQRISHTNAAPQGQMPPLTTDPTLPQNPRPSVSEISVVREWIDNCLVAN